MNRWLYRNVGAGLRLAGIPLLIAGSPALAESTESLAERPGLEALQEEKSATIRRYRDLVTRLEVEGGAYNPALTEPLLELGVAMQQAGMHAEAIDLLKRGVHLARVNNGLYSKIQLALLEAEIKSHIALGQFAKADDRQRYLYRVQQRTLKDSGRGFALMRQARWQRRAYELEIDDEGFNRLIKMWNLHRMALAEFAQAHGDTSATLLPPLYGMLRAQYLMSGSTGENSTGTFRRDVFSMRSDGGRSLAFRGKSYKQGDSVIRAIFDVQATQPDTGRLANARVLAMMGDWRLWHGRHREAMDAYAEAIIELATAEDAKDGMQSLFGAPVALPALEGIRPLPEPVAVEQSDILLEFSVDERGRVTDLQRLDENRANQGIANRIMRTLRRTPFRPRFDTGEAVPTTGIQWAYDTQEWQ